MSSDAYSRASRPGMRDFQVSPPVRDRGACSGRGLRRWVLTVPVAGVVTFGCGTPHAAQRRRRPLQCR